MSIGFKLMPGVRIRVGHRGVRAGIGPRIARVHVGSGRAGLSTGLGPLSLYASLGGSKRRRPSSSTSAAQHRVNIQQAERAAIARQSTARESAARESAARLAVARAEAQAQMNEAAERAMRSLKALTHVHLESFDTVTRPIAKLPNQRMSDAEVVAWYERAELKDVGAFDRDGRKAARERARTVAAEQLAAQRTGAEKAQARRQAQLDVAWELLLANDPDVIFETVAEALADNEQTSAPVGFIADGGLTVAMTAPRKSDLPTLNPKLAGGRWILEPLTMKQTDLLYLRIIASHVLVTAKEVFAVAPGLASAAVVVLANDHGMAPGQWTVILIAHVARADLLRVTTTEPVRAEEILDGVANVTASFRGEGRHLLPIYNSLASTLVSAISESEDLL